MATTGSHKKHGSKKRIVATAGILLGVGALVAGGAFAVFTSSDAATLSATAGQLGIKLVTTTFPVTNISPGDTIQRPMDITLPATTNSGELVKAINFSYTVSDDVKGTGTSPGDYLITGNTAPTPAPTAGGTSPGTGPTGLLYRIRTCSVAWTATTPAAASKVGSSPTYTCSGSEHAATVTPTATVNTNADPATLASTFGSWTATPTSNDYPVPAAQIIQLSPANFGLTPTDTGTFATGTSGLTIYPLLELKLTQLSGNSYENASTKLILTVSAVQRDGIQK